MARITKTKAKAKPLKPPVTPLAVKRSAELWLDFFGDSLMMFAEDMPIPQATDKARLLADAALDEFEDRWPGVKL